MAPRDRHCPLCHAPLWYSQKSLNWYAKDGALCKGDTLAHAVPTSPNLQLT